MPDASGRQSRFALLLLPVWLLVCARLLHANWEATGIAFHDTDDAMRMVQLRDFLAGQGWFDLHQPRLSPPAGYDSHWSRLIDAGLAAVYGLFRPFAETAVAERLLRAVWPLLWLLPAMAGAAAIAWRIAGREAAFILLMLVLACTPADQQFPPGRVDHHNVQIALTLLVVAAAVWSDRKPWCAGVAGGLTALTLAIGLEALPFLAIAGAALTLRHVATPAGALAVRNYALSLAGGMTVLFLATVAPSRWLQAHCDVLAINLAGGLVAGAAVLAVAAMSPQRGAARRAGFVVLAGLAAALIFLLIEPRCLAGPYALVDPRIRPIWLSDVRENQPALRLLAINPLTAAAIAAFPLATLFATLAMLVRTPLRRDFAFLTAAAAFVAACLATVAVIRSSSYALWLAMPPMAVALTLMFRRLAIDALWRRAAVALLLSPLALSSVGVVLLGAAGFEDRQDFARPESAHCLHSRNYRALAALPAGRVAADVSHGPFILALTPHSVLSAPYHRLSEGIVAAHRILSAPPDAAQAEARRNGVAYIALCGPRPPDGLTLRQQTESLWAALREGRVPPWLEPVVSGPGQAFSVYRLRP